MAANLGTLLPDVAKAVEVLHRYITANEQVAAGNHDTDDALYYTYSGMALGARRALDVLGLPQPAVAGLSARGAEAAKGARNAHAARSEARAEVRRIVGTSPQGPTARHSEAAADRVAPDECGDGNTKGDISFAIGQNATGIDQQAPANGQNPRDGAA